MTTSNSLYTSLHGVQVLAQVEKQAQYESKTSQADILTQSALSFVVLLHRTFNATRLQLLQNRMNLQRDLDNSAKLDFLKDEFTTKIRNDPTWTGPTLAPGLIDRRTEITGPPERNMIVNALNTPVKTYMCDFEDSSTPTWSNILNGHVNLYDCIRHQIDFVNKTNGKTYAVNWDTNTPTLMVRPRGWHMDEKHILVDGQPLSGSLMDFGLYFYHNAKQLLENGTGPYFYLPKMEHHLEAKLWNDVFNVAQDLLGITRGTIRATVLIETLPAAYQMEEIIYQLRQHSAGLNCGRWDYIFSTIKRLRSSATLPNRDLITMKVPFMEAYCKRLINICHRRQVHAMGGMAAIIPIKNDVEANEIAMDKVAQDKLREAKMHYDGTWIAHPALAPIANNIFNDYMPTANQIHIVPDENVTAEDLSNTKIEGGVITTEGIRLNVYIALCYIESWIRGVGCVPINNLMEDAATAEVSRLQLYTWCKNKVFLDDTKQALTPKYVGEILDEEIAKLQKVYNSPKFQFEKAGNYIRQELGGELVSEFLTTLLYDEVTTIGSPIDLQYLKP
ncbi:malate synthase 1, glyoxysomal [Spathaspora passalidarum NRRL Y-27907]|uniref:Malate synthase n=1 Tax=Spathaspora passalidarum (strain NRRL Y-27907 / 11-Y1) TaxID=619300 RepID=G3AJJ9_SPAPN|nr:malate synthase 1, glyoxysomal [Spathaspora passalidarum NRRL Y-27907]EGW33902.1 malate synthase 1, glyoxysomal [Spathaspora passalidarum NRRL Y-27907]